MNNVPAILVRSASLYSRNQAWLRPAQILVRSIHAACDRSCYSASIARVGLSQQPVLSQRPRIPTPVQRSAFSTSRTLRVLKQYPPINEPGLAFKKTEFTIEELAAIYGNWDLAEHQDGNRLLRVIYARIVDGTLDLPLDEVLQPLSEFYVQEVARATRWLRDNYPIDEEDAILHRFTREERPSEQEHPSSLQQRAFNLGLLKPSDAGPVPDTSNLPAEPEPEPEPSSPAIAKDYYGPQSGRYYAPLSQKKNDPYGRSQLEAIRSANIAKAEAAEAKLKADIDDSMLKAQALHEQRSRALESRREQGLEPASLDSRGIPAPREPNELEKWIIRSHRRGTSDLTLESPEVEELTWLGRILPSFVFVATCLAGLYIWREYWEPPRFDDRLFPNLTLAHATIAGLVSLNILVFAAWRFPPFWRLLNTYFVTVIALPTAPSMLGNTFSHQSTRHLLMNMFGLIWFGSSLHNDIGRENFIPLYLASGLGGSLLSLGTYAARGMFGISTMGASGAIWGVVAGYFWLHKDDTYRLPGVPAEWLTVQGWHFLVVSIALEVVGIRAWRADVAAHFGGMVVGMGLIEWWKRKGTERETLGGGAG